MEGCSMHRGRKGEQEMDFSNYFSDLKTLLQQNKQTNNTTMTLGIAHEEQAEE